MLYIINKRRCQVNLRFLRHEKRQTNVIIYSVIVQPRLSLSLSSQVIFPFLSLSFPVYSTLNFEKFPFSRLPLNEPDSSVSFPLVTVVLPETFFSFVSSLSTSSTFVFSSLFSLSLAASSFAFFSASSSFFCFSSSAFFAASDCGVCPLGSCVAKSSEEISFDVISAFLVRVSELSPGLFHFRTSAVHVPSRPFCPLFLFG